MPNDNIRKVYDALASKYTNMAQPYEEFESMMTDEQNRKKVYDALASKYKNMAQSWDEFNTMLTPAATQPTPQPTQAPAAEATQPTPAQPVQTVQQQPADTAVQTLARGGYMPRSMVPSSKEQWDEMSQQAQEIRAREDEQRQQSQQWAAEHKEEIDAAKEQMKEERRAKWQKFGEALLKSGSAAPGMTATPAAVAGGMSPSQQMAMENSLDTWKEYGEHKLVADALDEAVDYARAAEKGKGLGQGFIDMASRPGTWDFGYSDITKGLTLQALAEKWESGEPLSEQEEKTLDMVALATYITENAQNGVGIGYNVGASLPQSLGFMASLALNPASGLGRKLAQRAATKFGKAGLRALGDIAEMGVATVTSGGGRTLADALDRVNGSTQYEISPEGYVTYGGQADREELGRAALKAFGNNFIENYTEAMGEYFTPLAGMLGTLTDKGMRRIGLGKMADFLNSIPQSQWGQMVRKFKDATKFNGIVGEVLEEEIGMFMEPLVIGDTTLGENFNVWSSDPKVRERARDNQLTTILSCALMSGALYGVEAAGARSRIDRELRNADHRGSNDFAPEEWAEIKGRLDNADPEQLVRGLKDIVYNPSLYTYQRRDVVDYAAKLMQTQQFNTASEKAKQEMDEVSKTLTAAYDAGYRMGVMAEPRSFRRVNDAVIYAQSEVDRLGLGDVVTQLQEADAATRSQVLDGLGDEQRKAVEFYLGCSERQKGLYEGVQFNADSEYDFAMYNLAPAVVTAEDSTRTITSATAADGRFVYVISQDGAMSIIVDEDGKKEPYPTDQLSDLQVADADAVEQELRKALDDKWMSGVSFYEAHNEKTQEPQIGMVIGDGDETVIVTDMGEGWATVQQAETDKDGNIGPKPNGTTRDVTKEYLLALQDQIYDKRDMMDGVERAGEAEAQAEAQMPDSSVPSDAASSIRARAEQWAAATGVSARMIERAEDVDNAQVLEALAKGVKVSGWYNTATGEVCFYMPNIMDASEVDKTFIHEVVGHKGMRLLLGEQGYAELCGRVWNELMSEEDKQTYLSRLSSAERSEQEAQLAAADEFIAYFAERMQMNPTEEDKTLWDRFVQMVQDILSRLGLGEQLTTEDLSGLLQASLARYREEVAEQQQAQQPSALESIPSHTDEKTGETDYEWAKAPDVQTAIAAMKEAGYDDDVIRDYANDMIASLEAEAKKLGKPKAGTTMAQRQQMKADLKQNEQNRLFWQAVTDAMALNEQAEEEAARQQQMEDEAEQEAIDAYGSDFTDADNALNQVIDEMDFESMVRYYAAHAKYIWADSDYGTKGFASHMFAAKGNKRSERLANIGWLANRDKGGYYPEEIAERIFADLPESIKQGHDEMETLDIIISTIQSANHPATVVRDMYASLIQKQQEAELAEQQRMQEEEERQQDAYARDYGFANYQEMLTFEELWASGEDIVEIPAEQLENYYNTLYGTDTDAGVGTEGQGVVQQPTGQNEDNSGSDTLVQAEGPDSGSIGDGTAGAETGADAVLPGAEQGTETIVNPYTSQGEKTITHPANLRSAYESGVAENIAAAEKAVGDFIMSQNNLEQLEATAGEFKERKKKAEKDSAEYRMDDFCEKKCRERIKQIKAQKEQDRAQAAIDVLEEDEETAKARKFLEGTGKKWRDKPLTTPAEVRWFMNWINYKGSLSKVITSKSGKNFIRYQANGSVTPNIYLGETTPREILKQFLLYGNVMQVNIPTDIQREFEREQADAKKTSDALWADDRERIKNILTNAGIPFHDVIDSERGSRIVFTDRKNDNGNYLDYMDVSDADQAKEDIEYIRNKAEQFKPEKKEDKKDKQERPLIIGPEPLNKGEKWNNTGEPEKFKFGKKHDSHDSYYKLGNKTYGLTTADAGTLEVLAEDYGSLTALWNAYEAKQVLLSPELAAAIKAQIEYAEKNNKKTDGPTLFRQANDRASLMGAHNISEEKLRKILKQGGMANPSMAIVDTDKHIHRGYGDISLIPYSSTLDANKRRGVVTYNGDAYSPSYPGVTHQLTDKGVDKIDKMAKRLGKGDKNLENYLHARIYEYASENGTRLSTVYLLDKGLDADIIYEQGPRTHEEYERVKDIIERDNNGTTTDEDMKTVLNILTEEENVRFAERLKRVGGKEEKLSDWLRRNHEDNLARLTDANGQIYYGKFNSYLDDVRRSEQLRNDRRIDIYKTEDSSLDRITKASLTEDYWKWVDELFTDEERPEMLFAGFTPAGYRRWVPNTLENASRLMNKQPSNNADEWSGWNATKSLLLKRMRTLSDIRRMREQLTSREEYDKEMEELSSAWTSIVGDLSDMQKISDNQFSNMDYAENRLQEAILESDPIAYLNKEYGYDIDKDGEFAKDLQEAIDNAKAASAVYFEAKFSRPVYLNEFKHAIVPRNVDEELINALKDADIQVTEYMPGDMDDYENKVRQATEGDTDVRFREANENQAIFVSNAAKAVGSIKQEKATPDQWIAMIQKQGGIKAGEDKWLGLSQWIKTMKEMGAKTLTKQEILDYIDANKIQIEEQRYAEAPDEVRDVEEVYPGWNEAFYPDPYEDMSGEHLSWNIRNLRKAVELYNEDNSIAVQIDIDENGEITDSEYDEILDWAIKAWQEVPFKERYINDVRLGYTTEGLENNREIALWIPGIEPWNESDNIHFGDAGSGRAIAWIRFGDARGEVVKTPVDRRVEDFDEPVVNANHNLLYYPKGSDRYRTKEYVVYGKLRSGEKKYVVMVNDSNEQVGPFDTLDDAKEALNIWYDTHPKYKTSSDRILVIDEIQSKRHQEGREHGYKGQFSQTELDQAREEAHNYSNELYKKYGKPGEDFLAKATKEEKARFEELNSRVSALTRLRSSGIPDAPFDKNWQELAMKRMLRLAAEEGYDKIAWTTGEQQSERYNIGGYLSSIKRRESNDINEMEFALNLNGDNSQYITTDKNGNVVYSLVSEFRDRNLADIIGKELAEKALALEENEELDTDDITISNSGMATFCDKMLVNFMNKYGKQWGVKVEDIDIPGISEGNWENAGNGLTMHSINVTDQMKKDVTEGQTMFREVTDPLLIETLEAGKKQKGYRTVAVGEDGTLGSPMAGSLGKKGSNSVKTSRFELGKWEQAEENPQIATEDGKVNLIKPNSRGSVGGVDYNPYIHIRPTSVNKQFTQAWSRPELAYIETEYPERELTSGYKADKAKLSVGRHPWNGGELILSRWDKPTRIVPWEEVADEWAKEFKDSGVTFDIVSPHMLDILAGKGVKILPPKKAAGKAAMDAYKKWLGERGPEGGDKTRMRIADEALQVLDAYENGEGLGSYLDLVDSIENSDVLMEDKTLSDLVKEYRTLQEIDRLEGRRDYTGGEMDDMVEDEIIPRLRRLADDDTRFRVTPEQDAEYRKAYEEGDTEKAAQMVKDVFKAMYPDTKVVDEKGEPMVVYHGTPHYRFNAFAQPGTNLQGLIWTTGAKKYAETYAAPDEEVREDEEVFSEPNVPQKDGIYSLFVNIKNPIELGNIDDEVGSETWDAIAQKFNLAPEELFNRIGWEGSKYKDSVEQGDAIYELTRGDKFVNLLKEYGFDGVIAKEGGPGIGGAFKTYGAASGNQVKSAEPFTLDDNGKLIPLSERFSDNNWDIRFREAEQGSLFSDEEMNGGVGGSQRSVTFAGNNNGNERSKSDIQRQGGDNGTQDTGRGGAATSRKAGEIIKPLRKLKEGETCLVERKMTKDKNFSFIGPDRIETSADVAYIFKELENKAIENAFLVFQGEEGTPAYVLHVGMGNVAASSVDLSPIIPMIDSIKPKKIWLVHNHPSGQLKPSRQDNGLLQAVRSIINVYAPEVAVPPGIIIDTTRGVYGEFDGYGVDDILYELEASDVERKAKYPVYKFDEQAFSKDYVPDNLNTIRHSGDVAKFVATHRLGERSKINILVLNAGSQIVGNFFSDVASLDNSGDALRLARECGRYMTATDGAAVIVFGTGIPDIRTDEKRGRAVKILNQALLQLDTRLLDVQSIDKNDPNMDYPTYYSYVEHGAMEEAPEYGDVRMRVSDGVEDRRENESPREFVRRMQIEYRKRFNEVAPMIVLPEQKLSKPEIKVRLGLSPYANINKVYETYEDLFKEGKVDALGWNLNNLGINKTIIFAKEDQTKARTALTTMLHENVHAVISESTPDERSKAAAAILQWSDGYYGKNPKDNWIRRYYNKWQSDSRTDEDNELIAYVLGFDLEDGIDRQRAAKYVGGFESLRGYFDNILNKIHKEDGNTEGTGRSDAGQGRVGEEGSGTSAGEVTEKEASLKEAEEATDTNPTEGQKEAGNYKHGHTRQFGMDLSIENPEGSTRSGVDPDGNAWSQVMKNTYGYIRGTMGRDKDHIDFFLGPDLESDNVYIVDQRDVKTGAFDEHKVMLGFDDIDEARDAYNSNYEEGWQGLGAISELSMDEFKEWAFREGRRVQPYNGDVRFRVREEQEYERIEKQLGTAAARYERAMDDMGKRMTEVMQDSMKSVDELQKAIEEESGKPIRDYENAYWAAIQYSSRNKAAQESYDKLFWRPLMDEVSKLIKGEGDVEAAMDELNAYLLAKHGLERNEVFARRDAKKEYEEYINQHPNGKKTEDEFYLDNRRRDYSGLTALMQEKDVTKAEGLAQALVDSYEKNHDTTELWKRINAATKETLRTSYNGGLLSEDKYKELLTMFQNYVPLRGFDETTSDDVYGYYGTVNSPYNTAIKHAKGRRSLADSPLATIANIADSEIMRSNRNRIYMSALALAEGHRTPLLSVSEVLFERNQQTGIWEISLPQIDPNDTPEEVAQKMAAHRAWFANQVINDPANYRTQKEMQNVPYKVISKAALSEHQILATRAGKQYIITVNGNPRAAQALSGKTNADSSLMLPKEVSGLSRWISRTRTQWNVGFVLRNLFRDGIFANINVRVTESPSYANKYNVNWVKSFGMMGILLHKYNKGTLDDSVPMERYFKEFIDNGGETGYTKLLSVKDYKKVMEKEIKKLTGSNPTPKRLADGVLKIVGGAVENMNRWAEGITRFAAYMTSREQGRSVIRSVEDAKEISVNFNKKGSGKSALTDKDKESRIIDIAANFTQLGREGYSFFNANIQGLAKFIGNIIDHPGKGAKLIGGLLAAGVIMGLMNGGDGDDDDEKEYYNLPEYIRRSCLCFKAGKHWMALPLPPEYAAVYGMGELLYSASRGNEYYESDELAYEIASQFSQLLPLDLLEGRGSGAWQNFIPTGLRTLVENATNTNWMGQPIYNKSPYNENDPKWRKAFRGTSPVLVNTFRKLNEMTGGNAGKAGWLDLNPATWEHFFEGYFGGIFSEPAKIAKAVRAITGDEEMRDVRNYPIISGFMRDANNIAGVKAENSRYYKINDYVDGVMNEDRRLRQMIAEETITGYDYDDKDIADAEKRLGELHASDEWTFVQRWKNLNKVRDAVREAKDKTEAAEVLQKKVESLSKSIGKNKTAEDSLKELMAGDVSQLLESLKDMDEKEMLNNLTRQMNDLYREFRKKKPEEE